MPGPRVYVSSGLGFTEAGRSFYCKMVDQLAREGFKVLDPWRPNGERWTDEELEWYSLAGVDQVQLLCQKIALNNEELALSADAILAVLDGPDVDSGVAAEVGFASAHGKPIVGLRSDRRRSSDSIGSRINLQVMHSVLRNEGSALAETLDEAILCLKDACDGHATGA